MNARFFLRPLSNIIHLRNLIFLPASGDTIKFTSQRLCINNFITSAVIYKGKDKGKEKNKKDVKVNINFNELSSVINVDDYKSNLQKHLDRLKDDYVKHVTLRTSAGSLESIKVSFEGKQYELQELAQVSHKNSKTTILNMATFPQAIPAVLAAINSSGLNLNPQQDGTTLFVPIPKVTKEYRENLSKNAKALYVKFKGLIQDVENDFMRKLKRKENELSKDLAADIRKQIVAFGHEYIIEGRNLYEIKHKELMKE